MMAARLAAHQRRSSKSLLVVVGSTILLLWSRVRAFAPPGITSPAGAFVYDDDGDAELRLPAGARAWTAPLSSHHRTSLCATTGNDNKEKASLDDWESTSRDILEQAKDISSSIRMAVGLLFQPDDSVQADDIVALCDTIDEAHTTTTTSTNSVAQWVRLQALHFQRYELLTKLMRKDYASYIATASFLSPSRIPRLSLPNVQDVPIGPGAAAVPATVTDGSSSTTGVPLVPDCDLPPLEFKDNPLDVLLLSIFRKLVTKNTNGLTSDTPGIRGLLDQGRTFMLQQEGNNNNNSTTGADETQHAMVRETLGDLMTPVLPPFYRIFMAGIVPSIGTPWDGKQLGPWFYAPWLTSMVTPTFFGFLVGPSYPNRRKDGQLGTYVYMLFFFNVIFRDGKNAARTTCISCLTLACLLAFSVFPKAVSSLKNVNTCKNLVAKACASTNASSPHNSSFRTHWDYH